MASPSNRVPSHTSSTLATGEQAASTLLSPFSRELTVDTELKLSDDDFKQSIEKFYESEELSAIDQLKATPPYPTPHVLAHFANMTYADYQCAKPKPPAGWKLLTTASNCRNGYFGTAYLHPKYQQVVIAHRGTDTKNLLTFIKDVGADFRGVLCNKFVAQMSSACTFANKVAAVLQEMQQENKVDFEIFFTGHSLGGWLAQITTFTTEYLEVNESHEVQEGWLAQITALFTNLFKRKRGIFLKKRQTEQDEPLTSSTVQDSHDVTHSYHPHTVVFDSPGCKAMLLQMDDKFDVRLTGHSIDLQQLDITSYLSAPNLINTCNRHLGTVYRIFTDLSDMGWKDKHTPLYNLATHSMVEIVKAFDSETGQVRKDNEGELKVQEVVDWPVSAGLRYGKELNDFFKWAKCLNKYHPQVKDKSYHSLRYQTRAYDECTNSLSIFNKDQREFLEHCLCLLELKKLFNMENFFSVMGNAEAEKEVEQKLQDFKLKNKGIRCRDASTLHAIIPYVKRLVRLFPHIIEDIKKKLSPPEIINQICQEVTQRYVEEIHPNALEFNEGALGLKEFLGSDQQIGQLRMTDGEAWTGITQIYWVLQNTSCRRNYNSEGRYSILQLKWLLTVNRVIKLNALLESIQTPHLLMIECETIQQVNEELENMLRELFDILENKEEMKMILTVQSEDSTADSIQEIATETLGEGFITTDKQLTWSDLTESSQAAILEKTVILQGRKVALNQLTSAESMTDSFPLADLLQEKEVRIGEEPVLSAGSGYNEMYYIDRTFNHNIVIRQDIEIDKREGKYDLLARTKPKFEEFCQQNPSSNVHLLEKDESGELVWKMSQGNLQTLRNYIDNHKSCTYAPSDIDKLLQQAKNQKFMIIADKAGMGKTTVLTHLSKQIKQKFPANWLVRIDLNDYTDLWGAQTGREVEEGGVVEFLSKEVLKLESDLEKELFKKCFEGNEISKVVVMVDGVDEISPTYKQTVLDMLQVLKQTSIEQLWVTTRPILKEDLEDNLQQFSYTLQPFSEVEQVEFLNKFWSENVNLEVTNQHRLDAAAVIGKLAHSISDKNKEFTGIPLQINMLAEVLEEDFTSFYTSQESELDFPHKLDWLYRRFIDKKYDIYNREKSEKPSSKLPAIDKDQRDLKQIKLQHRLLALQALFPEDWKTFLDFDNYFPFSDEELARIGIVQRNNEGKPQFIHRTFAEYLVAEFLIKELRKNTEQRKGMHDILLKKVLLQTDCQVIRSFLDGFLENSKPSNEAFKEYGEKLNKQLKEREEHGPLTGVSTALHTAAKEGNASIIGFLLDSLKSGEVLSTVTGMLLATDGRGRTALHKAAENDSVQALKKIWDWAEEVTTWEGAAERDHLGALSDHSDAPDTTRDSAEEEELQQDQIKNRLFSAKDNYGKAAWHAAAQRGSVKALETLWDCAKELKLNLNELLLAETEGGNTAWHLAAQTGHLKLLQKLEKWAKEARLNSNELKDKLLLAKDQYEYTVWHRAAEGGSLEALQTLWILGKKSELKPDEMLLAPDKEGNTAWQVATQKCHFEVLKKLWEWAKGEQIVGNLLKDELLLATDQYGNTAWHRAAERGNLEILETLWIWANEVEIDTEEVKKNFFLAKNKESETAWHLAADRDHFEVLKKMSVWAEETQKNPNDLRKQFLQTRNKYAYTAWHRAAQRGRLKALEMLWGRAKEVDINPDELKKFCS